MSDITASVYNALTGGLSDATTAQGVNSQLAGRTNGLADAYRHMLLGAELTRVNGTSLASAILDFHEYTAPTNDVGIGMDYHNNYIAVKIGQSVANQGGTWQDIQNLVNEYFQKSLSPYSYSDFNPNSTTLTRGADGLLIVPLQINLSNGLVVGGISILNNSLWEANPNNLPANDPSVNWPSANSNWLNNFVYSNPSNYSGGFVTIDSLTPTNYFSITNSVGTGAAWDTGLTADFANGIALSGNGYGLSTLGSTLNGDGLFNLCAANDNFLQMNILVRRI